MAKNISIDTLDKIIYNLRYTNNYYVKQLNYKLMKIKAPSLEFSALCQETYHRYGLGRLALDHIVKKATVNNNPKIPTHIQAHRPISIEDVYYWAEEYGGIEVNQRFNYPNAQNTTSTAITCTIDGVPKVKNPFVVALSGSITAPLYALDVIRHYAKKYNQLLPFIAVGNHDTLFSKLYKRDKGIVTKSEADAYCNIMSMLSPECYANKYRQDLDDIFYNENLRGLYAFAKLRGFDEVSFILCSGQPWYDKRLLGKWMYMLQHWDFKDVKVNLVLVHCPAWLNGHTPDNQISKISLARVANSIGILTHRTAKLDGKSEIVSPLSPQRYVIKQGLPKQNYCMFEQVIKHYNALGLPVYSSTMFNTKFKQAVEDMFLAYLYAYESYTPEEYEDGIRRDIAFYQNTVGRFTGTTEEEFLKWCIESPNINFWAAKK